MSTMTRAVYVRVDGSLEGLDMSSIVVKRIFLGRVLAGAAVLPLILTLTGCGAGGTATNAAAEAEAAKAAKQDLDSAKLQIDAAQKLQDQRLKQADQQ